MDSPCQVPIEFYAGETWAPLPILWIDINGNPINLTGYTATMSVRQTINSSDPPLFEATTQNGQLIISALAGSIQTILSSSFTSSLPNPFEGFWDLWVYSPIGVATRLVGGPICIKEPVTRA